MLEETAEGRRGDHRGRHLRGLRRHPRGQPEPDRRGAGVDIVKDKPIINVPGCPPIPVVMTGVLAHFLTFGKLPELDALGRPKAFYGETIHDRCYRRPFYERASSPKTFDDEGARKGWCLFKLGCKGPVTYNACATTEVERRHVASRSSPATAASAAREPDFWDRGGFYKPLSAGNWERRRRRAGRRGRVGVALGRGRCRARAWLAGAKPQTKEA